MGSAAVLQFTSELESLECAACGMLFAAPANFIRSARERGNSEVTVFCPSGHHNVWRKSEIDRLKESLVAKEAAIAQERRNVEFWRTQKDQADHRVRAQKAVTTKLRKRIGAGVCPCCHRTFSQLAAHMADKHPEMAKTGHDGSSAD